MTLTVQMLMRPEMVAKWRDALSQAFEEAGLDVTLAEDPAPETVDYIIYAPHGAVDFTPYTQVKLVQGLWAGVESVIGNTSLTQPYARMVDEGLAQGMIEWVTGHVLRHHLGMDRFITATEPHWDQVVPPLATERGVTVLGLGELGASCASALARLGFDVAGWSRSPKEIAGVRCFSGESGLEDALRHGEITVLLLPATPETDGLLNADRLATLPKGAVLLNPGRGALIDDGALLAALDAGQVAHATLDTFRVEPLPEDHPFWAHPNVTITPHIASETRPVTASRVAAENIRRVEAGEAPMFLLDRSRGY